jgi:hypothetical protein
LQERERQSFWLVFWLNARRRDTLLDSYVRLADLLGLNLEDKKKADLHSLSLDVCRALQGRASERPFLLIVDDASDVKVPGYGGSILVTSGSKNCTYPKLDSLCFKDGLELIARRNLTSEEKIALLKYTRGVPLAINGVVAQSS